MYVYLGMICLLKIYNLVEE